ncbi:MAG: EthD family reductase [Pseudoxanthomonas sp.]
MVVIYKKPKDPDAFDKHYFETHVPLAKRLPGLIKYEVSKGQITAIAGNQEPYLIGILYFDSMAALKEAFASECGKACAADRRVLAPEDEDVQMYLYESQAV